MTILEFTIDGDSSLRQAVDRIERRGRPSSAIPPSPDASAVLATSKFSCSSSSYTCRASSVCPVLSPLPR